MAQAQEEVIQEYKANFKDTDHYLGLMRDAVVEDKESLKQVDSSFDDDYYDRLILSEPQTSAPEDPVGFDQLDPIGTLGTATRPSAYQVTAPIKAPMSPIEALVQQPIEPIVD